MQESWKIIPDTKELYEVSDHGRVRRGAFVLKLRRDHKRYWRTELSIDGIKQEIKVHRAVLSAFVGPCPDGMECLHKDSDPGNNRLDNLRWGTRSENIQQTYDEGRKSWFETKQKKYRAMLADRPVARGEQLATSLTEDIVMQARRLRSTGASYKSIAEKFGVPFDTMYQAITGVRWSHLPNAQPKVYHTRT